MNTQGVIAQNKVDEIYTNIQGRLNKKDKLEKNVKLAGISLFVSFFIIYTLVIFVSSFTVSLFLISCIIPGIFLVFYITSNRKSDKIKIADFEKIFYELQKLRRDLIGYELFINAKEDIHSCVLFLNDIINKYKDLEFVDDVRDNLKKIEKVLREQIHPFIETEDNHQDTKQVELVRSYLNRVSIHIYKKNLTQVPELNTESIKEVPTPFNHFIPLSIHRLLIHEILEYTKNRPVERYLLIFSLTSLFVILLVRSFIAQEWASIKEDWDKIVGASALITYGIGEFIKSEYMKGSKE